jgi:hypothetical protein
MSVIQQVIPQLMDSDTTDRGVGQLPSSKPGSIRSARNIYIGSSAKETSGVPANAKGMVEILWAAPPGNIACVGAVWDEKSGCEYGLIWNDLGNHSVIRYNPAISAIELIARSPLFGFDPEFLVTGLKVINGEYLYWTDYKNQPFKINILRALNTRPVYNLYVPTVVSQRGQRFYIDIYLNGGYVSTNQFDYYYDLPPNPPATTKFQIADLFKNDWNGNPSYLYYAEAESCGQHIELRTALDNVFFIGRYEYLDSSGAVIPNTAGQLLIVPETAYHAAAGNTQVWTEEQVSWRLMPPPMQPTASLGSDPSYALNFIGQKCFQFAINYHYVDGSVTKLSPYSEINVDSIGGCSSGGISPFNYIRVNFASNRLDNADSLAMVEYVELFVRNADIGSGVPGAWMSVKVIPREEFTYSMYYDFYNNSLLSAADPVYAGTVSDAMPLLAKSFEVVSDTNGNTRGVLSGLIEGYGNECINAPLTLSIDDSVTINGNGKNIRAKFQIVNILYSGLHDPGYNTNQPIHSLGDDNNGGTPSGGNPGYAFGGFGSVSVERKVGSDYTQWIPEAGFTFYLAGTNYWATSRQNVPVAHMPCGDLSPVILDKNVYDSHNTGDPLFGSACQSTGRSAIRHCISNAASEIYSEGTIPNVPPGRYILRVASHLISHGDVLGLGRRFDLDSADLEWHKSSTYVLGMAGKSVFELIITIREDGTWEVGYELREEYQNIRYIVISSGSGQTIDIDSIWIADLTDPGIGAPPLDLPNASLVFSGNVVENKAQNDDAPHPLTSGNPMERQVVAFRYTDVTGSIIHDLILPNPAVALFGPELYVLSSIVGSMRKMLAITDHNGFFYSAVSSTAVVSINWARAAVLCVTSDPAHPSGTGNVVLGFNFYQEAMGFGDSFYRGLLGSTLTYDNGGNIPSQFKNNQVVFYNHTTQVYEGCKTEITGYVTDDAGRGISDIRVVYTAGMSAKTGSDGSFKIITFGDSAQNINKRQGTLYYYSAGRCNFSFSDHGSPASDSQYIDLFKFEANQQYSLNVPYVAATMYATLIAGQLTERFLRSGTRQFGLVYSDDAGRTTFVQTDSSMRVSIPEYTENLFVFDPITYPVNPTYKYGAPVISWQILSPVPVPPVGRFTHYQWVRTKETTENYLLQWAAKDVKYVIRWDDTADPPGPVETFFSSGNANEIYIDISNLTDYKNIYSDSLLGYTWTEGDMITLLCDSNGNFYPDVLQFKVKAFQNNRWLVIDYVASLPELLSGTFFRLYQPNLQTDQDKFYEICSERYEILDPNGSPVHSVTSGVFNSGDCYFRPRLIPCGSRTVNIMVEDFSISDFFPSRCTSIGRQYAVDSNAAQLDRPTATRLSNAFLAGSKLNGLSNFEGLNIVEFDRSYGLIQKLVLAGETLVVICSNRRYGVFYPGQVNVKQADGTNIRLVTDSILGHFRPAAYHAGTLNPESVVENNGVVKWWDVTTGEVVQHDYNGGGAISRYQMQTYFAERAKELRQNPKLKTPAVYDRYRDLYILTFPKTATLDAESVAYDDGSNSWQSFWDIVPDYWCQFLMNVASFKNGRFYLHNADPLNYGNFYGTQYPMKIRAVFSTDPSVIKFWLALILETVNEGWTVSVTNDRGQVSGLIAEDFFNFEGHQKSYFLRDAATPNVQDALLSGDVLRSESLVVEISNDSTGQVSIFALDTLYGVSERTGH